VSVGVFVGVNVGVLVGVGWAGRHVPHPMTLCGSAPEPSPVSV
jgi:hypothetical protein